MPEGIPELRRGSEMVPESHGLPKMNLGDFKLIVVLGKGSFGKVSTLRERGEGEGRGKGEGEGERGEGEG